MRLAIALVIIGSFSINGLFSQCGSVLPNLGNDTLVCQGQSVILNPGTFDSYLWDNNSTSPTRAVTQTGTYWVKVGTTDLTNNLIVNGDFEQGNSGFSTGYIYTTTSTGSFGILSQEGRYTITSSPSLAHNNFTSCTDHTPNPGNQMMVVNGASTPTNVWCQTVNVTPNTDYYFGTWVSSALTDANVAQLQFSINNTTIGAVFSPPSTGCTWTQFYQVWNSGANTTAQICILNQNTNVSGNDFMIDDITFSTICYENDTIHVTSVPRPVISVTQNDSICAGELSSITASSASSDLVYTWTPGNIQSNELNVSPAGSTFYSVTAVDTNGCVSNLVTRLVYVAPSPAVSIAASADTICIGNQVVLTASSGASNLTYQWSPVTGTSNQISDTPSTTTQYIVQATNAQNCSGYDTITIVVIPELTLSFSGNTTICIGDTTQITVTANYPQTQFLWGDGTTNSFVLVAPLQDTFLTVTGSYYTCPIVTDSVFITVNPLPTIQMPADIEICKNETVGFTAVPNPGNGTVYWTTLGTTGASQTVTATNNMYIVGYAEYAGCVSAPDSFFIHVLEACDIVVPNVFTPNKDGVNDFFSLISADGIQSLECIILNRWGNEIRTFDLPDFAWDGKDKSGNELVEGVYFYKISGLTTGGGAIEKHGFVSLER
jgi:gliding motility-associated-like protein